MEAACLVLYRQYCNSQYDCKLTTTSIELLSRKMSATRSRLLLQKKQKARLARVIFRLQEELLVIAEDIANTDKQLREKPAAEEVELLQENVSVWKGGEA